MSNLLSAVWLINLKSVTSPNEESLPLKLESSKYRSRRAETRLTLRLRRIARRFVAVAVSVLNNAEKAVLDDLLCRLFRHLSQPRIAVRPTQRNVKSHAARSILRTASVHRLRGLALVRCVLKCDAQDFEFGKRGAVRPQSCDHGEILPA